jgi:hypothetical protein
MDPSSDKRPKGPLILEIPDGAGLGFQYVMAYTGEGGIHLIGSDDGINWERSSDVLISTIKNDTQNSIVYDSQLDKYVMYLRAAPLYRSPPGYDPSRSQEETERYIRDYGLKRRIARLETRTLWDRWGRTPPQTILIPDEVDHRERLDFFYGMPAKIYGDIYWGFLFPFKWNSDIHTELAFSRDGFRFDRLPEHPKLIERGNDGAWDDGQVYGSPWVEVGDEWWIYYAGWDGPHRARDDIPGIGLVKSRKEGFISMRGPAGGGVIVTRVLRWPGGRLIVNADADTLDGELKVRITDRDRKPISGFDYDDIRRPFTGNSVAHIWTWKDKRIESLQGQSIRLEFFLKNADIYTFRAEGVGPGLPVGGGSVIPPERITELIPCFCLSPDFCSSWGPDDRTFSCGRPVPWSSPLEFRHPINHERSVCVDNHCREFIGFRRAEDAGRLHLRIMASRQLSFELLDDSGKIIGQATSVDKDKERASRSQEQLEYQLFVHSLKQGRYLLKVSGPPSTYQIWAAGTDLLKK